MVLHPPFKRSPEDCGSFLSFGEGRCPAEHLTGLVFWVEAEEAAEAAEAASEEPEAAALHASPKAASYYGPGFICG